MAPGPSSSLQLPSFLHGTYADIHRKTRQEGWKCGEQYSKDGTFPTPRELLEVRAGEVVLTHEVTDFHHERPAWRLYMVSNVVSGLCEALDGQNPFPLMDAYEAIFSETAWFALFFVTSQAVPNSAERVALRLRTVLRFWEQFQSVRYLYKKLGAALTLEELMVASSDWAMDAWCPVGEASVRARLETAAERMARATREDCLEAIMRGMPRALAHAGKLKHREVVADAAFQCERLAALAPSAFERLSGAYTAELIGKLHDWDYELGLQ
jgi:hypothetical protein